MCLVFLAHTNTNFQAVVLVLKLLFFIRYSSYKPETLNIDCWHRVEAIGIASWEVELSMPLYHWKSVVTQKKDIPVALSLDFLLPYLLCYTLLHYFNISTNFKLFSFQWYQLYAYPGFRAWITGSLLWARHSDRKWRKKGPSLMKFSDKNPKTGITSAGLSHRIQSGRLFCPREIMFNITLPCLMICMAVAGMWLVALQTLFIFHGL